MSKKESLEELIKSFRKIHGDRYDYSNVVYRGANYNIEIICSEHGSFFQKPSNHKQKYGCPKCGKIIGNNKKKTSLVEVINSFRKIHGDRYDYSNVVYVNSNTKVEIICSEHGSFFQKPMHHVGGNGCSKCSNRNRISLEERIEIFNKKHNYKYDYSKVLNYKYGEKIEVICPEHGSFFINPSYHRDGTGCPDCFKIKSFKSKKETILDFEKVHNFKYDYSKVDYVRTATKVEIICSEHGSFWQTPMIHKKGANCPKCNLNKVEYFIQNILEEYGIKFDYNNRNIIKPLEIDFLIPNYNFGIEVNGLTWHSFGKSSHSSLNNYHKLDRNKHLNKTIEMEKLGYQLFHIREDHLKNQIKKEIWKSILLNKCNISYKIHARKLQVVQLPHEFIKDFLTNNHLQGSCVSSINLGLQDPKSGIIYSIMTFGKSRFNKNIEYELLRFCNAKFHSIRGAASKLLKHFERTYKPQSLISYANRDWSQGNLYKRLGFEFIGSTKPNFIYYYPNTNTILNRLSVQKHLLPDLLKNKFDNKLTAQENLILNGYRIYYDTGNLIYHKYYKKEYNEL